MQKLFPLTSTSPVSKRLETKRSKPPFPGDYPTDVNKKITTVHLSKLASVPSSVVGSYPYGKNGSPHAKYRFSEIAVHEDLCKDWKNRGPFMILKGGPPSCEDRCSKISLFFQCTCSSNFCSSSPAMKLNLVLLRWKNGRKKSGCHD
ncbi:hypothetical protein CEXT_482841 [Caerostris extrusa]|uniref:Uncharacterized protein n=1 Tax=Caerostris extrusa TaxID=172846 RepID=A0AAV4RW03_CAEEX|nr:hypothetical protein CEXT_482841 [Caerostris extrusa]